MSAPSQVGRVQLKDVVNIVKGVVEWYGLGLQLDVPVEKLDAIEAQHLDPEESLRRVLHDWLQLDVTASYAKLANALDAVNRKVVAEDVRRRFGITSSALALAPVQEKPAETGE